MKKINIFVVIAIGIIIFVSSWIIFFNPFRQPDIGQEEVISEGIKKEAILVIDNGEEEPKIFKVEFNEKITAFDLLKKKTEEIGLVLKTKIFDIGVMIESIGDKENGENGKYWMYYVNGEMPMMAVDKKEIKAGDKIEFKFEKSPF